MTSQSKKVKALFEFCQYTVEASREVGEWRVSMTPRQYSAIQQPTHILSTLFFTHLGAENEAELSEYLKPH